MNHFSIPLDRVLRNVTSRDGFQIHVSHVEKTPEPISTDEVLQSLQTSLERISQLERLIASRLISLNESVLETAVQVARSVLNGSDELIEQRVTQYVKRGVDALPPKIDATVYVSPDCLSAVQDWVRDEEITRVSVLADKSVGAGDVRVETDHSGLLLELDSYLHEVFEINSVGSP
ncbi:FliH/SctL family protein [Stieleria varia]|uniref:Flagellar assembly protein FliH n=1 Tax=Stieleria varia TaxID=2528005 RepID=A0A5C6AVM1_9BACT|nr:FliH/SctL family protein [Stieleria varia]TWU02174.1 flagellar assembly protein H [Stieleria varia]